MIPMLILAPLILLAAMGAVWLAKSVHAALMLALALALHAVLFLVLGTDFIGLVQFMVYVGAVAILIVFALLMTRPGDDAVEKINRPEALVTGLACTLPVAAALITGIAKSPQLMAKDESANTLDLAMLGKELFTTHVTAVLAIAVMLTAVLIGAALFARGPGEKPQSPFIP